MKENNNPFNFSDFATFKVDGNSKPMSEFKGYMNSLVQKEAKIKEKLNIGDEVELIGREYIIVVEYLDYEIKGIGKADYAGKRKDKVDNNIYFFNQREISKIVFKCNNMGER